jgi:hypothetical protein
MAPRFADLESRVSGAVFAHLSNAVATFDGSRTVAGIFDEPYAQSDIGSTGFASERPTFKLPTASVPPEWWARFSAEAFDVVDLQITVRDVLYQVVRHEPDGTGVSTLVLEMAAQ